MEIKDLGNKIWTSVFIVAILVITFSCNDDKNKLKSDKFYYVSTSGASLNREFDTSLVSQLEFHSKKDSLFATYSFVLDGRVHELRRYSNMHNSSVDGMHFSYELDSLGVIYSSSFTFQNQMRLISSSDSLNRILVYALGESLFISELNYTGLYENHRPLKSVSFKK